jgi:hypothetical protein
VAGEPAELAKTLQVVSRTHYRQTSSALSNTHSAYADPAPRGLTAQGGPTLARAFPFTGPPRRADKFDPSYLYELAAFLLDRRSQRFTFPCGRGVWLSPAAYRPRPVVLAGRVCWRFSYSKPGVHRPDRIG